MSSVTSAGKAGGGGWSCGTKSAWSGAFFQNLWCLPHLFLLWLSPYLFQAIFNREYCFTSLNIFFVPCSSCTVQLECAVRLKLHEQYLAAVNNLYLRSYQGVLNVLIEMPWYAQWFHFCSSLNSKAVLSENILRCSQTAARLKLLLWLCQISYLLLWSSLLSLHRGSEAFSLGVEVVFFSPPGSELQH